MTLATAYYFGRTNTAELFDYGSIVAIVVFISGALMWGSFPNVDGEFVEQMGIDEVSDRKREMSLGSKARGATLMVSGILFVLCSYGTSKVIGMIG